MRIKGFIQTFACASLLFFSGKLESFGQGTTTGGQDIKAITTAVPFLMIGPDSRSGGIGEAGVAVADNANAAHWNLSAFPAFSEKKFGIGRAIRLGCVSLYRTST